MAFAGTSVQQNKFPKMATARVYAPQGIVASDFLGVSPSQQVSLNQAPAILFPLCLVLQHVSCKNGITLFGPPYSPIFRSCLPPKTNVTGAHLNSSGTPNWGAQYGAQTPYFSLERTAAIVIFLPCVDHLPRSLVLTISHLYPSYLSCCDYFHIYVYKFHSHTHGKGKFQVQGLNQSSYKLHHSYWKFQILLTHCARLEMEPMALQPPESLQSDS